MYDRDRLLESVDLAGLADSLLGEHHGSARSPTWSCPNPNHAQTGRTPPVSIFRGRSGFERWHCHGCGAGGTAIDLVMATRNVNVREALEELATKGGVHEERSPSFRPAAARPWRRERDDRIADPEGLVDFVESCARRLWTDEGKVVRTWLTETRGLPEDVLRKNCVGADSGAGRQPRPEGMPNGGRAAVLPVIEKGQPIYAQLRALGSNRRRYLNPASELAPNPRLGRFEPVGGKGSCVLLTEGIVDALSAASAGYRAAAVLGAAVPEPSRLQAGGALERRLKVLEGPIVLALDADEAGQRAADRLSAILDQDDRDATRLHLPPDTKDLNEWHRASADWSTELESALRMALEFGRGRTIAL